MILQALTKYYEDLVERGDIAPPGWTSTKINYALCINQEGDLEQVIPLVQDTGGKKPQPQIFNLPAPVKRSGSAIRPNYIWDNSSYILGVDKEDNPERSARRFDECRKFHHQLLDNKDDPEIRSLLAFFDKWNPAEASSNLALKEEYEAVTGGGNLLFRINGEYLHENRLVRQAWQEYYDHDEGEMKQCLVTGSESVIAAVHPAVKGVDGAQSSGAAIVSFNEPAFCSYGQKQSNNAPVGKYAAFAYTSALNYLFSNRDNVQKIGDTSIVCWAEGGEPQYREFTYEALFGNVDKGLNEDDIRNALKKLARGQRIPELKLDPQTSFYILGISPNAARLSIRFFYRDSFGNIMKNVNEHHERMEIVRPSYDKDETISLWKMLRETVNLNSRDKSASPVMAGAVARAVFTGGMYPAALIEQTMIRIRAEHEVTRGKAAIIKAYYLRNPNKECPKEVLTVALNEESTNTAYNLGRLFSIYEAVQDAANPGINTTIKDKYFNSAAATPSTIFPILNNLCQKHLRKLEKGKQIWFERQIVAVTSLFDEEYPGRLTLPQQGSFQLGYYHQTQKRYEKKEEV